MFYISSYDILLIFTPYFYSFSICPFLFVFLFLKGQGSCNLRNQNVLNIFSHNF